MEKNRDLTFLLLPYFAQNYRDYLDFWISAVNLKYSSLVVYVCFQQEFKSRYDIFKIRVIKWTIAQFYILQTIKIIFDSSIKEMLGTKIEKPF